jgi:hypothetical protein
MAPAWPQHGLAAAPLMPAAPPTHLLAIAAPDDLWCCVVGHLQLLPHALGLLVEEGGAAKIYEPQGAVVAPAGTQKETGVGPVRHGGGLGGLGGWVGAWCGELWGRCSASAMMCLAAAIHTRGICVVAGVHPSSQAGTPDSLAAIRQAGVYVTAHRGNTASTQPDLTPMEAESSRSRGTQMRIQACSQRASPAALTPPPAGSSRAALPCAPRPACGNALPPAAPHASLARRPARCTPAGQPGARKAPRLRVRVVCL